MKINVNIYTDEMLEKLISDDISVNVFIRPHCNLVVYCRHPCPSVGLSVRRSVRPSTIACERDRDYSFHWIWMKFGVFINIDEILDKLTIFGRTVFELFPLT